jgi:hypothetical protein
MCPKLWRLGLLLSMILTLGLSAPVVSADCGADDQYQGVPDDIQTRVPQKDRSNDRGSGHGSKNGGIKGAPGENGLNCLNRGSGALQTARTVVLIEFRKLVLHQ